MQYALRNVLLPGVALALLAGCTLGEGRQTSSEGVPVAGGVLRLVNEAPNSLDPIRVISVYESLPVNQLFDGLVRLDESLHIVPSLASTWTISRDQTTYVFHLRPDARFHDGSPVTADDVAFSIRRVLAPDASARNVAADYLVAIEGAESYLAGERPDLPGVIAVDERTVRIRLERPYVSFLEVLAMDGARIVPRAAVERLGARAFGRAPVGTGPFRFGSWTDSAIRLEANRDHFAGAPNLDAVEIAFLREGEDDLGASRLERGEVDVVELPADDVDRLAAVEEVRIVAFQELSLAFLGFLTTKPPLDDRRVRQALAHAIDREAIVADAPRARRLATGILPPGLPGYSPKPKALSHDRRRAMELLAEAGYPGGRGLPPIVAYSSSRTAASARLVERVRESLEEVGVAFEVRALPWGDLGPRLEENSAPAFLLGWVPDLADPDSFLRTLFRSDASANYFRLRVDDVDRLLLKGAREMNPVERAEAYRRIEKEILGEAPLVPLYHTVVVLAHRRPVRGLHVGPLGVSSVRFAKVWLDREGA